MKVQGNFCVCVHYFQPFFHYFYEGIYWSFYWRLITIQRTYQNNFSCFTEDVTIWQSRGVLNIRGDGRNRTMLSPTTSLNTLICEAIFDHDVNDSEFHIVFLGGPAYVVTPTNTPRIEPDCLRSVCPAQVRRDQPTRRAPFSIMQCARIVGVPVAIAF